MNHRLRLAAGLSVMAVAAAAPAAANADSVFGGGQLSSASANFFTFNINNGSGFVAVNDAQTGQRYAGQVSCVRVSGNAASFIVTIDPTLSNSSPTVVAQEFWVADNGTDPFAPTDAQRNTSLTAKQLTRLGGACPDPTAPPKALNPIALGDIAVSTTV